MTLDSNQPFRDLLDELGMEAHHLRNAHITSLLDRVYQALSATIQDLDVEGTEHIIGVLQADRKVAKAESARWRKRVENFRNQTLSTDEVLLIIDKLQPKQIAHLRRLVQEGRLL